MQFLGVDQQDITGHDPVLPAFDSVGHITGNEKVDLVEIMVVQFHILQVGIPFVLQFKILTAHILTGVETVCLTHGTTFFLISFMIIQCSWIVNKKTRNIHNVV